MPDQDDIERQQERLKTHRFNVHHWLRQSDQHGGLDSAPTDILHQLNNSWHEIARIKQNLRGWGVQVEDHYNDFAPTQPSIPSDGSEIRSGRHKPQKPPATRPWRLLIAVGLVMVALGGIGYAAYRAVNPDPAASGTGGASPSAPLRYTRSALVTAPGRDIQPSFSRDGKTLVFISARDEENQEIYTLDMVTRQEKRLTFTPDINEDMPSFFDDDRKIIYGGYDISSASEDIFIMNADGTDVVNLTNTPTISEGRASFSRSGAYVVYDSTESGTWGIYRATLSPDNRLEDVFQIIDRRGNHERFAHFSPLENQIVFRSEVANKGSGTSGIFLIDIDGKEIENISLFTQDFPDYYPMFSPNGKTIVFASKKSQRDGIYFYPVTANLPPAPPPTMIVDSEADDRYPAFATHGGGSILAYSSDERAKDDFDIYVLEFDTPFP